MGPLLTAPGFYIAVTTCERVDLGLCDRASLNPKKISIGPWSQEVVENGSRNCRSHGRRGLRAGPLLVRADPRPNPGWHLAHRRLPLPGHRFRRGLRPDRPGLRAPAPGQRAARLTGRWAGRLGG